MFKEIVRNYTLQQLEESFSFLQIVALCIFEGMKQEEITAYVNRTRSFLENREYSKISTDDNNIWLDPYCATESIKPAIYYLKEQYGEVISACKNEKMQKEVSDFFISIVEFEKENSSNAFAKLIELSSYKSKLPTILKNPLAGIINEIYSNKNKDFFAKDYRVRKMFIPIEKIADISGGKVPEVLISELPNLVLPVGHPIPYEVYVGHPLDKNVYFPISSYQVELLKDKIHEFCYLVQCLGATELTIEAYNAAYSSKETNNRTDANAELGSCAKANYHNERKSKLYEEISNSMSVHQQFTHNKEPFVPEGLMWFQHEVSWQRMASQRLVGGLTFHEERMETKKVQMLESRELTQVKAQVKALFVKADFTYDSEEDSKFEQHENDTLSIKVKF